MEVDFRIIVSISNVYAVRFKCMLKLNAFGKEEEIELIPMFSSAFSSIFPFENLPFVRTTSTPFC